MLKRPNLSNLVPNIACKQEKNESPVRRLSCCTWGTAFPLLWSGECAIHAGLPALFWQGPLLGFLCSKFQTGCLKNFTKQFDMNGKQSWKETASKKQVNFTNGWRDVWGLCCLLPFPASLRGLSLALVDAAEWTLIWWLATFVSRWNMTLNPRRVYWSNTSNTGFQLGTKEDCTLLHHTLRSSLSDWTGA